MNARAALDATRTDSENPRSRRELSNEIEISHGRVSWQTHCTHFGVGPLASSICFLVTRILRIDLGYAENRSANVQILL